MKIKIPPPPSLNTEWSLGESLTSRTVYQQCVHVILIPLCGQSILEQHFPSIMLIILINRTPVTVHHGKSLEYHFENSRCGNILEFGINTRKCAKPWKESDTSWRQHSFCGNLLMKAWKCFSPSVSVKLVNRLPTFNIKALENVKNTLEKSLNFSNAKVLEPWE